MISSLFRNNRAILIGSIVSLAVIGASYVWLYVPKSKQVRQLAESLPALHERINEYQLMVQRVPDPDRAIDELQHRVERLKERAASREEVPRMIQQLAQQSGTLDVEIVSIAPREDLKEQEGSLPEGVSKVYIEVSLRCPYDALGRYIESLGGLPTLFTIEDLNVGKDDAETTGFLDVQMIVSTYVLA